MEKQKENRRTYKAKIVGLVNPDLHREGQGSTILTSHKQKLNHQIKSEVFYVIFYHGLFLG